MGFLGEAGKIKVIGPAVRSLLKGRKAAKGPGALIKPEGRAFPKIVCEGLFADSSNRREFVFASAARVGFAASVQKPNTKATAHSVHEVSQALAGGHT